MHEGIPLTDAERAPWLDRLNRRAPRARGDRRGARVLGVDRRLPRATHRRVSSRCGSCCSPAIPSSSANASPPGIGHFAGPDLLPSQLDTLEIPADAVTVNVDDAPDVIAQRALDALQLSSGGETP